MLAKIAAACGAACLFLIVVATAAASALTTVAMAPLHSLWAAITGDPRATQQRFTAEDYVHVITGAEQNAPTRAASVVIAFAAAQIGRPYLWGGDGPEAGEAGYDCSGLTKAAYAAAGITIPRTATDQYRKTRGISFSEIQPGDLVFYGSPAFAHHVAIYVGVVSGIRVVLDAPRTGQVIRLDPLDADDLFAATRPAQQP